jgi:uncharacterized cupin superfamily protein
MRIGFPPYKPDTIRISIHGEAQGYQPLPVRHAEYEPGIPMMETHWMPTADDIRKLLNGEPIRVRILGSVPPPMNVFVGDD